MINLTLIIVAIVATVMSTLFAIQSYRLIKAKKKYKSIVSRLTFLMQAYRIARYTCYGILGVPRTNNTTKRSPCDGCIH